MFCSFADPYSATGVESRSGRRRRHALSSFGSSRGAPRRCSMRYELRKVSYVDDAFQKLRSNLEIRRRKASSRQQAGEIRDHVRAEGRSVTTFSPGATAATPRPSD